MNNVSLNSYTERRRIREELERSEVQGLNLDPTVRCKCDRCGAVHYRPKERNEIHDLRKQENQGGAQSR